MARGDGGGGGGAFGWTVLGILVGVTATLAVQTLIGGRSAPASAANDEAAATAPAAVIPAAPPVRHVIAPAPSPANVADEAPKTAPAAQTDQEVQDDADAVGMTSRVKPADATTSSAPPVSAQN